MSGKWRRSAVCAWISVLLAGTAFLYWQIAEAIARSDISAFGDQVIDFARFYAGAELAWERGDLYDVAAFTGKVREVVAPLSPSGEYLLQYPPYFFALVQPLTVLPLAAAWLVWTVSGMVLLLLSLYCHRLPAFRSGGAAPLLLLATLASYPAWLCFRMGQSACLPLAGLALFWLFLRRESYLAAALATALLMMKPQYAPLPLVVGLLLGGGKFGLGLVASAAGLLAAALLAAGPGNLAAFPRALLEGSRNVMLQGTRPAEMENLRGLLASTTGGDSSAVTVVCLAVAAAVLAFFGWSWYRLKRMSREAPEYSFELCAGATTLAAVALSPQTYEYDCVILALAAAFLWQWCNSPGAGREPARWLGFFLVLAPLLSWSPLMVAAAASLPSQSKALLLLAAGPGFHPAVTWSLILLALAIIEIRRVLRAGGNSS